MSAAWPIDLLRPEEYQRLFEIFQPVGECPVCHESVFPIPILEKRELPATGWDGVEMEGWRMVDVYPAPYHACLSCGVLCLPADKLEALRALQVATSFYNENPEKIPPQNISAYQ